MLIQLHLPRNSNKIVRCFWVNALGFWWQNFLYLTTRETLQVSIGPTEPHSPCKRVAFAQLSHKIKIRQLTHEANTNKTYEGAITIFPPYFIYHKRKINCKNNPYYENKMHGYFLLFDWLFCVAEEVEGNPRKSCRTFFELLSHIVGRMNFPMNRKSILSFLCWQMKKNKNKKYLDHMSHRSSLRTQPPVCNLNNGLWINNYELWSIKKTSDLDLTS